MHAKPGAATARPWIRRLALLARLLVLAVLLAAACILPAFAWQVVPDGCRQIGHLQPARGEHKETTAFHRKFHGQHNAGDNARLRDRRPRRTYRSRGVGPPG